MVCDNLKAAADFPQGNLASGCSHPNEVYLDCVSTWIQSRLDNLGWRHIKCPQCDEPLKAAEVNKYADQETFTK